MSLLKWKELAKRKTELGNKINSVHNAITQHKIGEETSKGSFDKLFKPVTSKLDDVIVSNLKSGMPQRRKRPQKKGEVPDYGIDIEDEVEDMGLESDRAYVSGARCILEVYSSFDRSGTSGTTGFK